jgi:hypothetical protein
MLIEEQSCKRAVGRLCRDLRLQAAIINLIVADDEQKLARSDANSIAMSKGRAAYP